MPRLRFRANSVWLNILNAPARNSVFTRSVIAFCFGQGEMEIRASRPPEEIARETIASHFVHNLNRNCLKPAAVEVQVPGFGYARVGPTLAGHGRRAIPAMRRGNGGILGDVGILLSATCRT